MSEDCWIVKDNVNGRITTYRRIAEKPEEPEKLLPALDYFSDWLVFSYGKVGPIYKFGKGVIKDPDGDSVEIHAYFSLPITLGRHIPAKYENEEASRRFFTRAADIAFEAAFQHDKYRVILIFSPPTQEMKRELEEILAPAP
jgi:hypothetical protein